MALKLGKCRLCLKLGDFYSIFTVDNSVQLAEMVMECSRIKVYEGDGLPDKVCSECIQKLSSAYIFKQQCERSDQELRRNYVPPPGFSASPTPNRQSSDSAFSTHTDLSVQTKPSSNDIKVTPAKRSRKRSKESDNTSNASHSRENSFQNSKVQGSRVKKPRLAHNYSRDSDYEDTSFSHFSPSDSEDASDAPKELFKCDICSKAFETKLSMNAHRKVHSRYNKQLMRLYEKKESVVAKDSASKISPLDNDASNDNIANKEIAQTNLLETAITDEDKISCDKCGKTFKLKIMLNRHYDTCIKVEATSPKKELVVALKPIDTHPEKIIPCGMCPTKFKTIDNLEKHMRVCHSAVLKNRESLEAKYKTDNAKVDVPCLYCKKTFNDYYVHSSHFNDCPMKTNLSSYDCSICNEVFPKKSDYILHIRMNHFAAKSLKPSGEGSSQEFECRMCNKKLPSQDLLISHLAAHVSNIEDDTPEVADDSRSEISVSESGVMKCRYCDKTYKYKNSLITHEAQHTEKGAIKKEFPEVAVTNFRRYKETDSDDSSLTDNTCDICEKQFSYKRLLLHHKKTKHNISSGVKRANFALKDCKVQCMICDLELTVANSKAHNQIHIEANIKPRNMYVCNDCGDKFKSVASLGNHIKFVHRLQRKDLKKMGELPDLADFCEVVVTKAEPLDLVQSHNDTDFGEVPIAKPTVDLSGLTCYLCGKKMPTIISLKRHINWHSNVGNNIEKKMECFVCKEVFRFKGHYKLHMRVHYKDPNLDPKFLECTICNRKSKHLRAAQMHMNFHKQTRFKDQDYQCSICKRMFQNRKVYLSHMAIHYKRGDSSQNTVVGDIVPNNAPPAADGVTCNLCGKVCDSEVSLKHHTSWHKSKTSLFGARHECDICHVMFTNKRRMEIHYRTHYEDENGPFKCNICGKGYTDENYFKRHVKGHNFDHQSHQKRIAKLRENKVKCPICNRFYSDLPKLIRHLRRMHPQSKMIKADPDAPEQQVYSCKLCAKVFLDEKRLQSHEEAHLRKPEFFKCKFCGKKTISLKTHNIHIKSHLVKKHIDNPLKCTHCDEHFIKGYDLHYHLRDVHDINESWIADRTQQTLNGPLKDLQCSICLKVLASQGNFERHIDYHNSLRCNYCFDYFSSLRFLEGHLAFACEKKKLIGDTETIVRKIKCHICYKAFHLQVKLDCHLRTQHGIKITRTSGEDKKETICDYCFRVFENEHACKTHKIYHRTVGYYGCMYCDKKFNTLTLYRKHKNHHFAQLNNDKPNKCEHCDETFIAFRDMIYHMRDAHGDDKEWVVMPKESIEEKCPICNKIFFNLHKHLQYHEDNRCKKCAEYFYSRVDYDNHLCSVESDDESTPNENDLRPKYEECGFCFKPITRTSSKLKHDLIHRNSGSISCRFCSHKFKTIDAFNIHAFSHRSRKYNKNPIKCKLCEEKFVKYGQFIHHMKDVHKSKEKMHYRAVVKPERCVVCGDDFPNLHNHYRAHLLHRCAKCDKYFTSNRVFLRHQCDVEDADPKKVFVCDVDLQHLINTYVPKDEKDGEKYFGVTNEEEEDVKMELVSELGSENMDENSQASQNADDDSQASENLLMPISIQSPIISDVLSLYQNKSKEVNGKKNDGDDDVEIIDLSDDDPDVTNCASSIVIDDD